ncbi:MAG: TIGR04282 family arsenosugar biosynthesis glycosyltransferase [Pirellulales bacterium]|nr:TIGR04282 family arsenosugar biosynthesis glycosyltransferase [Pirellulales bacterium]
MNQLTVFAKYPAPGMVKTRLSTAIGAEQAAALARAMLICTLDRFAAASSRPTVACDPPETLRDFQSLVGDRWRLTPQSTGDLGQRLANHFDGAFATGVEKVVVIGADSPTLPVANVEDAFRRLAKAAVVLGPSDDGGYYLIGASRETPPVFANIDWSTPRVWSQTVNQLQSAGIPYSVLPRWHDIDDATDLERLTTELESLAGDMAPSLIELRSLVRQLSPRPTLSTDRRAAER